MSYSPIMMPPSTIWCAAFFCIEQASNSSAIQESWTISSRRMSESCQLREIFLIQEVSVIESESKESSTLEISRLASGLRLVSFARWLICACVSDIFLYNIFTLYKKYVENQGYPRKNEDEWAWISWLASPYHKTRLAHYCQSLLSLLLIHSRWLLFWTDFDHATRYVNFSSFLSTCSCYGLVFLYTVWILSSSIFSKPEMTTDYTYNYLNAIHRWNSPCSPRNYSLIEESLYKISFFVIISYVQIHFYTHISPAEFMYYPPRNTRRSTR